MIIHVPDVPPSWLWPQLGAIRARAGASLSMPLAGAMHWLLGSGPGCICSGAWPSGNDMEDRRIYHSPSPNAEGIVVAALVEGAAEQGTTGEIAVKTDNGGASEVIVRHDDATSRGRFDGIGWSLIIFPAYLADTDYQYHEIRWSDLGVRKLSVWELPRYALDPSSDEAVIFRTGVYAGIEARRVITDGAAGGIPDLLDKIVHAKASHKRHLNWFVSDAAAWTMAPCSAFYFSLMDEILDTSGGGWQMQARQLAAGDSVRAYKAHVMGAFDALGGPGGAHLGGVQLASNGDDVTFESLTGTLAYHDADSSETLDIACGSVDVVEPKVRTDYGPDTDSTVSLAAVSLVEE